MHGAHAHTRRRVGDGEAVKSACLHVCAASSLTYALRALCGRPCVVLLLTVDASCALVLRASLALQRELNVEMGEGEGRERSVCRCVECYGSSVGLCVGERESVTCIDVVGKRDSDVHIAEYVLEC